MQVSFVIPLFNCLAYTQACIASLRASLPADLSHEFILVDDGSTDGTREWLRTLETPFRVVLNECNLGYAGANNRGAALARGEYLSLLNNDLILRPGWLEPILALHRRFGPRAGVIGNVQRDARTGAVDHAGMFVDHKGKPAHDPDRHALETCFVGYRIVPAVTGACALIERSLWQTLGGFDEQFQNGGEDVDLCFRAAAAGRLNLVALRSVVRHYVSSSPGRKRRDEQNSYRLACKWSDQLARHGVRAWSRHYLEKEWCRTTSNPAYLEALACLLFATGIRRKAPTAAIAGMRAAIEHEMTRWRSMLGTCSTANPILFTQPR